MENRMERMMSDTRIMRSSTPPTVPIAMYSWCLLLPVDLPKFGISMDTSTTTEEILLGGWRDFSVCDGVI